MALTKRLFANNVRTTLAGSISAVDLTITFATGAGATMPNPNNANGEYFEITLQDAATGTLNEIIAITAMTGDIGTIPSGGRGKQGTSAKAWNAGDTAFLAVTKGAMEDYVQPSSLQSGSYLYAAAGGTADAITATFTPAIAALTDGMAVYVDAASANTTTTPTFSPNGLTAHTIVKNNAQALVAGDIAGAGHILHLVYRLGAAKWELLNPAGTVSTASLGSVSGKSKNLVVTTTGTSATITITADEVAVRDTSYNFKTLNTISLSVSGASSLDTGALAASTWYALYVIYNPTTLTTAGLLSLSATSPTLPSGYTYFAKIGDIRTDSSGNKYPLSMTIKGTSAQYKVAAGSNVAAALAMASGILGAPGTPTWSAVAVGNFVPATAKKINLAFFSQGSSSAAPNNAYGAYQSPTNAPPWQWAPGTLLSKADLAAFVLESANIYVASTEANFRVFCLGWEY